MKTLIVIFSILFHTALSDSTGDATFYGSGGAGERDACMLPRSLNGVSQTVAINRVDYNNGAACGKCIMIYPLGDGIGTTPISSPIFAMVDNECPECKAGDVDIGSDGNGRWRVRWEYVSCHRRLRGF